MRAFFLMLWMFRQTLFPRIRTVSEELPRSILKESWPEYRAEFIEKDEKTIVIQINGRLRSKIVVPSGLEEDEIRKKALSDEFKQDISTRLPGSANAFFLILNPFQFQKFHLILFLLKIQFDLHQLLQHLGLHLP